MPYTKGRAQRLQRTASTDLGFEGGSDSAAITCSRPVLGSCFADSPCAYAEENFYFSDLKAPSVFKVSDADGTRAEVVNESASGLEFGPNGLLYGCQPAQSRVNSIDSKTADAKVVATSVTPNDLPARGPTLISRSLLSVDYLVGGSRQYRIHLPIYPPAIAWNANSNSV